MAKSPKPLTEAQFERHLDVVTEDVRFAIDIFETHQQLHKIPGADRAILKAMNEQARYWIVQRHSALAAFFLATGRLFDMAPEAYSIHRLLGSIAQNRKLFSRVSIAVRKAPAIGLRKAGKYAAKRKEPTDKDMREIKKSAAPQMKFYEDALRPIRDEVFAHKIAVTKEQTKALWSKATIKEIDAMLFYMYELTTNLWELFHNGRINEQSVNQKQFDDLKGEATKEVEAVLKALCET